jgi:uncharacterized damage-inducible protein DinB
MINKPQPDEYTEYQNRYVKLVPKGPVLEILDYLRDSTYNFFSRMNAEQADYAYAEGKWTLKQVLGHMIDTEKVFSYRAFCFSRGEEQVLPAFDQDQYVENSSYETRTIQDLAAEFKAVRQASIYLYNSLTQQQQLRTGRVSDYQISVRALVYLTIGHEVYHLNLVKERYIK